jgi:hypothetical protein
MLHMTKQRDRKREQMRKRVRDGRNKQQQQQNGLHSLEEPDSDGERPAAAAGRQEVPGSSRSRGSLMKTASGKAAQLQVKNGTRNH